MEQNVLERTLRKEASTVAVALELDVVRLVAHAARGRDGYGLVAKVSAVPVRRLPLV